MPKFAAAAFKWGLTESDIQGVLDNPGNVWPQTTSEGHPGQGFVGPTQWGAAEVFTQIDPLTAEVVVYHARVVPQKVAERHMGR